MCCVVTCRALRFPSSLRRVALPVEPPLLCPVSFYCGISLSSPVCALPLAGIGRLTLPLSTGTPRRLTRLFQTWFCYLPNLIHRPVGKMCPSRVLVLNLTHTPFIVLLLTLVSPHSYGGRETVFEPFEKSNLTHLNQCNQSTVMMSQYAGRSAGGIGL